MSVVITGNPGVGKHTIAKEISKMLGLPIIDINRIAQDEELFEKNKETNDVDTFELKKIIDKKNLGVNLIVGHLAPYVITENRVKKIIILRRNPYDLLSVYKQRKYTDEKSKDNAGSEVLGIIAFDTLEKFGKKAVQINVSSKDMQQTIEKVKAIIVNNENNSEEIDWLELVTKNNDLKKFFTY